MFHRHRPKSLSSISFLMQSSQSPLSGRHRRSAGLPNTRRRNGRSHRIQRKPLILPSASRQSRRLPLRGLIDPQATVLFLPPLGLLVIPNLRQASCDPEAFACFNLDRPQMPDDLLCCPFSCHATPSVCWNPNSGFDLACRGKSSESNWILR